MWQLFGQIQPPPGVNKFIAIAPFGSAVPGLVQFLSVIIKMMIIGAGLYTLFNVILAGYAFLSAGDDSNKITAAWAKIWQSVLGLAISAAALVLAALIGIILFDSPWIFIIPTIYTPD